MELLVLLLIVLGLVFVASVSSRRAKTRALEQQRAELEPVRQLADEDVTALGTELQDLDLEMAGRPLDPGARSDYQRALDAYEAAKVAVTRMTEPDHVRHVTEILEDGRYAMACVRARVAGEPLPTRRPPCFFDPRHGPSVADVEWTPPGGSTRSVPACALDAERVRVGADPDTRQVMVGAQRMPYYEGGPAYAPYAAGYFGGGMPLLFTGLLMGSMLSPGWGYGGEGDGGDGGGEGGDGGGDSGGDAGGDFGGDFGGGDFGGDFGGFDF